MLLCGAGADPEAQSLVEYQNKFRTSISNSLSNVIYFRQSKGPH